MGVRGLSCAEGAWHRVDRILVMGPSAGELVDGCLTAPAAGRADGPTNFVSHARQPCKYATSAPPQFYETHLGVLRCPGAAARRRPPRRVHATGTGVALWLHGDDAQTLHDDLRGAGVPILAAPIDGPFGALSLSGILTAMPSPSMTRSERDWLRLM